MKWFTRVCLALRGQGNDAAEGLSRLRRIAKQYNHALSRRFSLRNTSKPAGDLNSPIDFDNINEAILGYGQVLTYINWEPDFPRGEPIDYTLYENVHSNGAEGLLSYSHAIQK